MTKNNIEVEIELLMKLTTEELLIKLGEEVSKLPQEEQDKLIGDTDAD